MCRRFGKNIFQIRYSLSLYENIEIRFKRPVSGYLTRQLSFLLNSYVYHSEGEDTDNPGILIPRYKALGRTAPNGEVYPTTFTGKPSEDDLVPVRSIVTKRKGDLNTITPDLIGIYKFKDLTDGSALGISFATSLTESTTQEILGLKHGGHERVLDKTGYLKAPKACTFREEGKFIYLKVRGKELKYPRPSNLVTLGKDKFEEGENVCCAYITSSPIMRLRSLLKVINAKAGKALRYYEKDDIICEEKNEKNDEKIVVEKEGITPDGKGVDIIVKKINLMKIPDDSDKGFVLNIKYKKNGKIYVDNFDTSKENVPSDKLVKYYESFIRKNFKGIEYEDEMSFE